MITDAAGVLRAGGLVPASTPASSADPIDTIDARAYSHAALGERTVVRLVASTLGPAEDLSLEFLGLQLSSVDKAVGRGRRQALGFPAWALVNDPANGAYALAVVKDMERLARLARAKPGSARDGYDRLADQLARSVPHFLPTFFEQVGRAYIGAEQANHAAAMFSRAREAERIYNLPVDEDRRREVFVEFALAGALSSKALDDLADQLIASKPPLEAYQAFRALCVQRTLGGIPPSTAIGGRLNKMAAAARLDVNAEARDVLLQLIDAPATARAGAGFWKGYRRPLLELARESGALRGKLLNLFPTPQPAAANFIDFWLELLDGSGATDALIRPAGSGTAESDAAGSAASWLSRLVGQMNQGWRPVSSTRLPGLIERMAPRLRADGVLLDLIGQHSWRANVDVIDLALALNLPLAPPKRSVALQVNGHGHLPQRDLLHIVQDPIYGPIVAEGLDSNLGRNLGHADQLPARPGVQQLFRAWLDRRADQLERGGLPQIENTLARLEGAVSEQSLALNPQARTRMASTDLATALARTLRNGIVDEFGWPALEEAHAKLQPGTRGQLFQSESWPNLVLADDHHAIVVGPDSILLEHDVRIPTQGMALYNRAFLFVGGQLLVSWYDSTSSGMRAYWTDRPGAVFDLKQGFQTASPMELSMALPDGTRTRGGRAIHPDDTSIPESLRLFTDGQTFWRRDEGKLREYDPHSGRAQQHTMSRPPLFEAALRDNAELDLAASSLLPALPGLEASPLGVANGLLGLAVVRPRGALTSSVRARRIDGLEFAGALDDGRDRRRSDHTLVGLLSFPGDETAPRPLALNYQAISVWSADATCELFVGGVGVQAPLARGMPIVPPPPFWHCLRPRDLVGSRALRALPDAVARQLLDSAVADLAAGQDALPRTRQLLPRVLPAVTDARLREGILGVCSVAAKAATRLADFKPVHVRAAPQPAASSVAGSVTDRELRTALSGLFSETNWQSGGQGPSQTLQQIEAVSAVAAGGDMPASLPTAPMPWAQLIGRLGAVAFRAASPTTPPTERAALLALLEVLAASPFVERLEHVRLAEVVDRSAAGQAAGYATRVLRQATRLRFWKSGVRTWFFGHPEVSGETRSITRMLLELSPDSTFELPKDCDLELNYPIHPSWDSSARIRAFVALLRERGPVPWQSECVERLAALTGMTGPESALLLAAVPGIRNYSSTSLSSDVRQMLGLNPRDARAAHDTLGRVHGRVFREVLAAAMPEDPRELWESDGVVERLAHAWNAQVGRRISISDDLVRQVRAAIPTRIPAADLLAACAAPESDPRLNRDGVWTIAADGSFGAAVVRHDAAENTPAFDGPMLTALAAAYAWLYANLPVGDPMRGQLPAVLERARQRLQNRDLLVGPEWLHSVPGDAAFVDALPGGPFLSSDGKPFPNSRDSGPLIVLTMNYGGTGYVRAVVRPAAALDTDDQQLVPFMGDLRATHAAARFLLGANAAAMAERVRATPVPHGGYEANPLLSAPDLVAQVASTLNRTQDAACAYLQLLALPEPATRNLALWNGWPTKRVNAALDALVERELLVRGKRARAGREVYLPGPWEDLKAPNLPIESWKLALFDGAPLSGGRVLALKPLHELFASAWQRLQSGELPAFAPAPVPRSGRAR